MTTLQAIYYHLHFLHARLRVTCAGPASWEAALCASSASALCPALLCISGPEPLPSVRLVTGPISSLLCFLSLHQPNVREGIPGPLPTGCATLVGLATWRSGWMMPEWCPRNCLVCNPMALSMMALRISKVLNWDQSSNGCPRIMILSQGWHSPDTYQHGKCQTL